MRAPARPWKRVIGIVGGLGPHAHVELEREILRAVDWAQADQDYPEWALASVPRTPDRTAALLDGGDSPVPLLARAVGDLAGRADFAVIACVTAHAFLPELRRRVTLPVLDIVAEAIASAHRPGRRRIGILATDGTLDSGIFEHAAARAAPGAEVVTLRDLAPDGARLQRRLVMRPVYRGVDGGASLKAGGGEDASQRERLAAPLRQAARRLIAAGAEAIVLGCTELPLALGHEPIDDVPLIDPIREAARAAVAIAGGERDLPAA